jgi:hypothetical protein
VFGEFEAMSAQEVEALELQHQDVGQRVDQNLLRRLGLALTFLAQVRVAFALLSPLNEVLEAVDDIAAVIEPLRQIQCS